MVTKEEIRREVRAYLAERLGLAFAAASIARAVRCDLSQVESALALLISLGQVEENSDSLGATKYYRITATGALAHERGE